MFKLLRYFSLAAGLTIMVVTGFLAYVFYDHEIEQLIASGETQNIRVARVLSNALSSELRTLETLRFEPDLANHNEVRALDEAIQKLAKGLPIIKVKFYALDGYTLYSSQFSQIGENKRDNPGFQAAADDGVAVSKLTHRDEFSAFSEMITNREVVETYIPIRSEQDDRVEAVFELYSDVTLLANKIDHDTILLVTFLIVTFSGLYAILFAIVHHADKIISIQYHSLAASEGQIRDKNARLEREIASREQAEQALQQAHDQLEDTVRKRTSELATAVENLRAENAVRREAEQQLQMLSTAVEQSPASVSITDPDGIVLYANPKFLEVSGYAHDEVIGHGSNLLKSGEMPQEVYRDLHDSVHAGKDWRGELLNRKKDGSLFWETVSISPIRSDGDAITHFVAVKEDISLRKQYEEQLVRQANYDSLTGLANRFLMLDRLSQAITRARLQNSRVALLFIDLDDFKKINDSLGHSAGDELLVDFGSRVQTCLREFDGGRRRVSGAIDTVARLGGDEFTVILTDLDEPTTAEWLADAILDTAARPYHIAGQEVFVTSSIGITVYPDDGVDAYDMMRNADLAMYRAKEERPGSFRFFAKEFNDIAVERLRIEAALRHAVANDELALHYQPIVDNHNGRICGAEALLRWHNPVLGDIGPARFIPIAESTGLIVEIGRWVLATGLRDLPRLAERAGCDHFQLSFNVSSRQLQESGFTELLQGLLVDTGVKFEQIRIEITESLILEETGHTQQNLADLSRIGARFSVDDFGTGYSSLRYLKKIPADTLKIDRSFVTDVSTDPDDASLVRSIAAMATGLGIQVIAEGVETADQQEFVVSAGIRYSQGWLTGRPVPLDRFNRPDA